MKDIPILFSAPMVRAILAGTKTQTRRALKPDGKYRLDLVAPADGGPSRCPYGQPDDRMWVRETFYAWGRWETRYSAKKGRDEWHFVDMTLESGKAYEYPATGGQPQPMGGKRHRGGVAPAWWKRPAIHMPRAASRITLEITGVRVERLQDISEADATAEGVQAKHTADADWTAREAFRALWESINGGGSWDADPWCWVVAFERVQA